ncbi:MAG: hypothetical protein AAF492_04670 [Verrucomicrobiota bacterium]
MTIATDALRVVGARAIVAVVLKPDDPLAGGVQVIEGISDGDLVTGTSGAYPNLSFKKIIAEGSGLVMRESLTRPGAFETRAEISAAEMLLNLSDEDAVLWDQWQFNGRRAEIYIGAEKKADGTPMDFDDFDRLLDGEIEKKDAAGDKQARLIITSDFGLESKASSSIFLGLGGIFPMRTNNSAPIGTYLTAAHDPAMDMTGGMGVEFLGRIESIKTSGPDLTPILMNGSNSGPQDMNYGLLIRNSDKRVLFGAGTELIESDIIISVTPAPYPEIYVGVSVALDGVSVTFYSAALGLEPVAAGTGTLTTVLAAGPTDGMSMGQANGAHVVPYETRLWQEPLDTDKIKQYAAGTIPDRSLEPDLFEIWRFNEGGEIGAGPERVFGENGNVSFVPVGDPPTWESSYTGDNIDEVETSVAGKTKPLPYGRPFNVPLTLIDEFRQIFAYGQGAATDGVARAKTDGVPMVPFYSVTGADIEFDGPTKTISLVAGSALSLAPFIAGQEDPPRLGQRVQALTGLNDGRVWRVESVAPDGMSMVVSGDDMTTQTGNFFQIVASLFFGGSSDVQYQDVAASSAVDLVRRPEGVATADIEDSTPVGWSVTAGELSGRTIDSSAVDIDGEVAGFVETGEGKTCADLLDDLAKSNVGWWIPSSVGDTLRLGTWNLPSGTPAAEFSSGEEAFIAPGPVVTPFWRFRLGYARNWSPQKEGLARSLTSVDRNRLSEEYVFTEPFSDRQVLADFPTAVEAADYLTQLFQPAAARAVRERLATLISEERRWFTVVSQGLWSFFLRVNDVIRITSDDPVLSLDGALARITSREVDSAGATITYEVFL